MATTPSRMLEIMSRKYIRRYHVKNIELVDTSPLALIVTRRLGPRVKLSAVDLSIIGSSEPLFRHSEIAKVHWMAKGLADLFNPVDGHKVGELKRRRGDSVVVELEDGRCIDLTSLGPAYLLILNYLCWYARTHGNAEVIR